MPDRWLRESLTFRDSAKRKRLSRRSLAWLFAVVALFGGGAFRPTQAYVEVAHSLGQVCALSSHIVVLRVEKVDKEKNLIIYRKVQDLKVRHSTDVIKHNIGRGGFHPREWQYAMEWAEPGKTAIFFHNGGASETCIGTYWYQAYAGGEWWNMSHGEPYLLRTFAGKPEKLAAAVKEMLAGREVVVPCMVDGSKEDLQLRRARIQRLRSSLKLADYNAKRDFVGWGGEDFRRLAGMPGFTHLSALSRVDPDAQADSALFGKRVPVTLHVRGTEGIVGSRVRVLDRAGRALATHEISGGEGRGGQNALNAGTYRVEVRYSSGAVRTEEITVAGSPLRAVIEDQ